MRRGRRSQFEAGAHRVRDERLAEAGAHGVLSPPSGAVSRDDHGRCQRVQIIEDLGDEWFEERSVEVKSTHHGVEGALLGQAFGIAADIHDPRVAASRDHQESLVLDVDDEGLVIEHQGVRFPPASDPGFLGGKPGS